MYGMKDVADKYLGKNIILTTCTGCNLPQYLNGVINTANIDEVILSTINGKSFTINYNDISFIAIQD